MNSIDNSAEYIKVRMERSIISNKLVFFKKSETKF